MCADGQDNDLDVSLTATTPIVQDVACGGSGETDCADGQDNDNDTLIDCDDPDCSLDILCGGTGLTI